MLKILLEPKTIVKIASHHHERLDGSGYPNGLTEKDLSLQDKVLQIADVTSALMQKRSYKSALDQNVVIEILKEQADNGKLDKDIIDVLIKNYKEITDYVLVNSNDTITRYENMKKDYDKYLKEYSSVEHESIEEFSLLPGHETT